ncbi:MAG TPA: hypothetical protein VNN08_01620, partial [Thermoanaerobaculia bacterium]|nr:hypothetical protein [Thermoanaerobaculia bacterium]
MEPTPVAGNRLSDPRLPELFSIASRDELWQQGTLVESRLTHGQARQNGPTIEATDARDEDLVRACNERIDAARPAVAALRGARVRVVVRATRENDVEAVETTITVAIGGVSVVTTPDEALHDYELLRTLAASKPTVTIGSLPIVWHNGSASVLLHEAVGHAGEHGAAPVTWPPWLSVDVPLAPRRETFRDVPLPRMTHLVARQRGAPFALPEERIDV